VCVSTSDTLRRVLQRMDGGGYRHVPVTCNGKPVSIISVRDMVHHITRLCQNGK
jgi:CBS domain-containing protein